MLPIVILNIKHKNRLSDFEIDPNSKQHEESDDALIDDQTEVDELLGQLNAHLPLMVTPSKKLVHSDAAKKMGIRAKDKLRVIMLHYAGNEAGIVCTVDLQNAALTVVSLTQLALNIKHPLYKQVRHYQLKRIKALTNQAF